MDWVDAESGTKKAYTFTYDGINRLSTANYALYEGSGASSNHYTVPTISYDANGNMLSDYNKGIISEIAYNYLNLPQSITRKGNTTNYVYHAARQNRTGAVLRTVLILSNVFQPN